MIRKFVASIPLLLCGTLLALADSNSKSLQPLVEASTPIQLNIATPVDLYFDQANAAFRSTEAAGTFLNLAVEKIPTIQVSAKAKKDAYYLIHVLRWKDPTPTVTPQPGFSLTVDTQNWYVYHNGTWSNEDFSSRDRLYGAKTVYLLYVELNVPAGTPVRPIYTLNYVEKTADNVNHLLSVIGLFLPSGGAGGGVGIVEPAPVILYGGGHFDGIKSPSDVTVSVNFEAGAPPAAAPAPAGGGQAESDPSVVHGGPEDSAATGATAPAAATPSTTPAAPAPAAVMPANAVVPGSNTSPTFDNEGKYWWDVSVAVPIRKISQTTIDNTAGTITPTQVDKQNAFAALNLYPIPIDTKRQVNSLIPHFIGGVAIASQPLHKILLAVGIGPAFANFYVGAVLVDQPQLLAGSTTNTTNKYSPQFAFGINLQVKAFQSVVSKSK